MMRGKNSGNHHNNHQKDEDDNNEISVVVVGRHGERLDYQLRDSGINWVATADKPFDPPLTEYGKEKAFTMGKHLAAELEILKCPPVSAIYTSPFLRCRQTSVEAQQGLRSISNASPPVRVELGLAESINEQWYRSWSLPGSDGTWGFCAGKGDKTHDPETLHSLAKQQVQTLLEDWRTDESLDLTYPTKTSITEPYCFHPAYLETSEQQRWRMRQVVESVGSAMGQTVLLVSHGGPVTHLYEELTSHPWHVHGESTYCCYSIYQKKGRHGRWEAVRVNQSQYLREDLKGDHYVSDTEA